MKKNKFMKLASGLLVLCLMTTCVIGATLAKYTTSNSSSDTAHVAKWGVTVSASGTLFGKDYGANGATSDVNQITAATSANVHADTNVVAPGTKNDTGLQLKVAGQPEVAFNVTAAATVTDIFLKAGTYGVMVEATGVNAATNVTELYTLSDSTYTKATAYAAGTIYYKLVDAVELSDDYHPIVWKLDGADKTATELVAAVEGFAGTHNAGDNVNEAILITWAWAFSTNDGADTILGNIGNATVVKASGENYVVIETSDYSLEVAFSATITATQID